jgi:hypothetical protein
VSEEKASDELRGGSRDVQWVKRYGDLVHHAQLTSKMPVERSDAGGSDENRLAGWVRYQRRRHERGILPDWQLALLQQIERFTLSPHSELWAEQYRELAKFIADHGSLPRYRSVDLTERALAAWVHKQRHLYRYGHLLLDRFEALRALPIRVV